MISVTEEKTAMAEKLKEKFQKDKEFKAMINQVNLYYGRKIMAFTTEPADKEFVEEHMLEVVSDQFLLGYYLMSMILKDPEFVIEAEAYTQPKGHLRNEVFVFLEHVMADSEVQWQQSEMERLFTKRVVANFYDAYSIMVQLRKDILALGAYHAFIENPKYQEPEYGENALILGNPFDLNFLSPQVFMQSQGMEEKEEKWTLFQAATVKAGKWVGDVSLTRRAVVTGEINYHLEILLFHLLDQNDRTNIINEMIQKIPAEEHSRTSIQFYLVSEQKRYTL